jgi:serine/threonine-protein kinase
LPRRENSPFHLALLGVVAYQSLTGRLPFASGSTHELVRAVLEQAPPSHLDFRPELGPEVGMVMLRALAKKPGNRFATCGQFAQALMAAMSKRPHNADVPIPVATTSLQNSSTA